MSDKPISDLRRRVIADMTVRSFSDKTRHDYIRHIEAFASFLGRSPATTFAVPLSPDANGVALQTTCRPLRSCLARSQTLCTAAIARHCKAAGGDSGEANLRRSHRS
jgi:hypothetical protein